jgi:hypothetical protein
VIRTPTATVTDLGTEFGVDVDKNGRSDVCVHSGKVTIRGAGVAAVSPTIVLTAGEARRIPSSDSKSWITLDAKNTRIAQPLTIYRAKSDAIASDDLLFSDHFQSFSLGTRWQAVKDAPPNVMLKATIDGDRTVLSMQSQADGTYCKAIETVEPIPLDGLKVLTVAILFQPRQGAHPPLELHVVGGETTVRMLIQPDRVAAGAIRFGQEDASFSPAGVYWNYRYYRFVLSLDDKGVTASFKDSVNPKPLWEKHFDKLTLATFGSSVKIMLRQVTHSMSHPSECNVDWLTVRGTRTNDAPAARPNPSVGREDRAERR